MLITIPHNHISKKLKKLESMLQKQNEPFVNFLLTHDPKLKKLTDEFIRLDISSFLVFCDNNSSFSFKKKSKYFEFFSNLFEFFETFDHNLKKFQNEFLSINYKQIENSTIDKILPEQKFVFYNVHFNYASLSFEEFERCFEFRIVSNRKVFFYNNKKSSKADIENSLQNAYLKIEK